MPVPETINRVHKAVLWPVVGVDNHGNFTVGPPQEVMVRWDGTRTQMMDRQGNLITLDATAIVDPEVKVGSHMWFGPLSAWLGSGSISGAPDEEVHVVKMDKITSDIKGRAVHKVVGLMRLHDQQGAE